MKTILIDSGRRAQTRMRHGSNSPEEEARDTRLVEGVHLQLRLERLGQPDPRCRQIVELKFFLNLTIHEIADHLGVSSRTVNDDWEFARCWLAAHWNAD